jgi:hypothetical protein
VSAPADFQTPTAVTAPSQHYKRTIGKARRRIFSHLPIGVAFRLDRGKHRDQHYKGANEKAHAVSDGEDDRVLIELTAGGK